MKQLDWYRNSSYQSKDIAHVQKTTTQRIADKVQPSMVCSSAYFPPRQKCLLGRIYFLLKWYCTGTPGSCMASSGLLGVKDGIKAVLIQQHQ